MGENLIANQEYSDTLGLKAKEEETLAQRQAKDYLGMDIPNELIITTKQTSIGLSILKAMRQSGNQTNNRIIGAAIPEKKPEFDQMVYKIDIN